MRFFLNVFLFLIVGIVSAQETKLPPPMIESDSLYREDQFFFVFTYNILLNRPQGVSQNKFSSGFSGGFLRDFPINKKRTVAFAAGLGVSYNKYFQNLVVSNQNNVNSYNSTTRSNFKKNKLDQIFIDVPIEIRWRQSTPESHRFWRIYSGIKLSYLVVDKTVFTNDIGTIKVKGNDDFNKFQAGIYLVAGYNTWNFYGYYGLNPLFKSEAKINNESIGFNNLNLGLMFYIL